MCSCLQCDKTPRYLSKRLLHRFRRRRQFLFQNNFACFIHNTVERPAISQIHTDRQLLLLENFVTKYLHSANLLHSRSPFCALSTSFIGSVSHPAGDRPSHPIWSMRLPDMARKTLSFLQPQYISCRRHTSEEGCRLTAIQKQSI